MSRACSSSSRRCRRYLVRRARVQCRRSSSRRGVRRRRGQNVECSCTAVSRSRSERGFNPCVRAHVCSFRRCLNPQSVNRRHGVHRRQRRRLGHHRSRSGHPWLHGVAPFQSRDAMRPASTCARGNPRRRCRRAPVSEALKRCSAVDVPVRFRPSWSSSVASLCVGLNLDVPGIDPVQQVCHRSRVRKATVAAISPPSSVFRVWLCQASVSAEQGQYNLFNAYTLL